MFTRRKTANSVLYGFRSHIRIAVLASGAPTSLLQMTLTRVLARRKICLQMFVEAKKTVRFSLQVVSRFDHGIIPLDKALWCGGLAPKPEKRLTGEMATCGRLPGMQAGLPLPVEFVSARSRR